MGHNVWLKCGHVYNLVSELSPPVGNITGEWIYKDSVHTAFQSTITGTGAVAGTITIQVSNDAINAIGTPLGVITLSGTTVVSDGFSTVASWKYVRAVVSATSGTISAITVNMGV